MYNKCIENLYLNKLSEEQKKEVKLKVMRGCPYTAFYAFIVKYCIKLIYANGNVKLLEDKKFLKQVNEKLKTLPRSNEIKQGFNEYFNKFIWPIIKQDWFNDWFHGYINKNDDEKQQVINKFITSIKEAFNKNPNALKSIKILLNI